MDLLNFVFDPLNFGCGFVAASAVYGTKTALTKWSNLGVSTKIAELSAEYKLLYSEYNALLEKVEGKTEGYKHDFLMAFPEGKIPQTFLFTKVEIMRTVLNGMLNDLNVLDNHHVNRASFVRISKSLADKKKSFTRTIDDAEFLLKAVLAEFNKNMDTISKAKTDAAEISIRLGEVQDGFEKAEKVFDRIFLEKIPPALFEAEKACERFDKLLSEAGYDSEGVYCWVDPSVQKRAESSVRKAENHLNRLTNYSVTAKREAAKLRQRLRSWPPRTAEQTVAYNLALESLMDAESRPYDKGNPVEEFDVATLPYLRYLHDRAGKRR